METITLDSFEEDQVLSGDLHDAIWHLKSRLNISGVEAKAAVFKIAYEVGVLEGEPKQFEGYCENLPIKAGMTVTIKKGTIVKTIGRDPKPAGKTYKVKVHHTLCGQNQYRDSRGFMQTGIVPSKNPTVCWAGPGGYWSEADINDIPEAFEPQKVG